MPNHVIRERIWESKKLESCSDVAAGWYPWIFLIADDHGRFEFHPRAIWASVFRRRPSVNQADVEKWLLEYEKVGLLIRYHIDGSLAFWTGFEGRKPSERRPSSFPDPAHFPEVKARLRELSLLGDGVAASSRRSRGSSAPSSRKNRASSEQIGSDQETDQSGSDQIRFTGARAPRRSRVGAENLNCPENRAPIEAYNRILEAEIGCTPGNLRASARAIADGYSLENFVAIFEAVRVGKTPTAAWCRKNNREFEYLIRPSHQHYRTKELTQGPLDKILNELGSGRKLA